MPDSRTLLGDAATKKVLDYKSPFSQHKLTMKYHKTKAISTFPLCPLQTYMQVEWSVGRHITVSTRVKTFKLLRVHVADQALSLLI